jgi:hypothetical protein
VKKSAIAGVMPSSIAKCRAIRFHRTCGLTCPHKAQSSVGRVRKIFPSETVNAN